MSLEIVLIKKKIIFFPFQSEGRKKKTSNGGLRYAAMTGSKHVRHLSCGVVHGLSTNIAPGVIRAWKGGSKSSVRLYVKEGPVKLTTVSGFPLEIIPWMFSPIFRVARDRIGICIYSVTFY